MSLPDRSRAVPLSEAECARAPLHRGVYAIWARGAEALDEAGVAGDASKPLYVGKAEGKRGLRQRVALHGRWVFVELHALLASRGIVPPSWWDVCVKRQPSRSLKLSPMATWAANQTKSWQETNLVIGWTLVSPAAAAERQLITDHQPLLNRVGVGLTRLGPPQLRYCEGYESARASWLFSSVWLVLLQTCPGEWVEQSLLGRSVRLDVDEAGWPVKLGHGRAIRLKPPTERAARRLFRRAASGSKIGTLGFSEWDDEACAWWGAYVGLTVVPRGIAIEEALRHATTCQTSRLPFPRELPQGARLRELTSLLKLGGHWRVRH